MMSVKATGVFSARSLRSHLLWNTCVSSLKKGWTHCQRNRQVLATRSTRPSLHQSGTHMPRDSIPANLQFSMPGRSTWRNVHCAGTTHTMSLIVQYSVDLRLTDAQLWHFSIDCATTVSVQDTTDSRVQARGRVWSATDNITLFCTSDLKRACHLTYPPLTAVP